MKKITYILTLLITLGSISACNEDEFLKEDPRDGIYAENLLVNYSGFTSMTTSLYGLMRHEYRRADALGVGSLPIVQHAAWACGVDNSWSNNSHSEFKFFYYPSLIKQTDLAIFQGTFEWLYKIINTSNMIITRAGLSSVNWEGGTDDANLKNKNEIIAIARFFRAWAYRHLTYTFGDVPLSTSEIDGLSYRTDWERNTVASIREIMEEDLKFAIEHLDLRTSNNDVVSGAMARHYLGELYLALGRQKDALTVLQPLVEGTDYSLMTSRFGSNANNTGCSFIDVFRTPSYKDGDKEVLFYFDNAEPTVAASGTTDCYMKSSWKNYYSNDGVIKNACTKAPEVTSGTATWAQMFWLVNEGKGAGRCVPSRGALRLYNYKGQGAIDDRISEYSMVWKIKDKNAQGQIVEYLNNGKAVIDTTVNSSMLDDTKTTIKKYNWPTTRKWDYTQAVIANGDLDATYADIVYLRLADTYLLYAEALYKDNQTTKAITYINKVRERSHAIDITESDLVSGGLDLILDERSRELLSEEERRHTLIRVSQENGGDERDVNNYFKRRVRKYNEICGRPARGMEDATVPVLFPIPQAFIDSNTGRVIAQNPGY